MIRWKVVTKDRKSAWVSGIENDTILTYEKGKTVKAFEGTPGIFVFKSKGGAKWWKKEQ